jgi:hypothetical protein
MRIFIDHELRIGNLAKSCSLKVAGPNQEIAILSQDDEKFSHQLLIQGYRSNDCLVRASRTGKKNTDAEKQNEIDGAGKGDPPGLTEPGNGPDQHRYSH